MHPGGMKFMEIKISIKGKEYFYDLTSYGKEIISFGKSNECDISISEDYVDDLQGCFYLENGKWYIKNLGKSHGIVLLRFNSSENRIIDSEELKSNSFFMIRGRNDLDSIRIYVSIHSNQKAGKNSSDKIENDHKNKVEKSSTGGKRDKTNIIIFVLIGLIFAFTITIGLVLILKSKEDSTGGQGSGGGSGHLAWEKTEDTNEERSTDTESTDDTAELSTGDAIEYMDKDEFIEYLKENNIDTDNDKYYRENSKVVSVVKADEAENVLSETDVYSKLTALGFGQEEVTASYTIDGQYYSPMEISEESTLKHPMYQTYYISSTDELWSIYVIDDVIMVNPVSYNLEKEPEVQVVLTEKDTVMSYDYLTNSFYETVPNETELKVIKIDKISADELDKLTVEEIDKLVK